MKTQFLKQSEAFALMAAMLLITVVYVEKERLATVAKISKAREDIASLEQQLSAEQAILFNKDDNTPPIIILSESEQRFRFASGSARIPEYFEQALSSRIITLLDSLSMRYDCDTIEIVGHTDEQPLQSQISNLDQQLVVAFREGDLHALVAGSNLDLGMLRALAIIQLLQQSQNRGLLSHIKYFIPYSAGQMIDLDRQLIAQDSGANNIKRRRIEIRLLNSSTRQPLLDL